MVWRILLILTALLFSRQTFSQIKSVGTPFITNYTRTEYKAGSQTWDIEQGSNGMMYFANNNGLLEYDGIYWEVYPMPNNSIVRSIKSDNDTVIYAGGFNEFGYYKIGNMGGAKYYSLTHLLPENKKNFGDVWNIYIHPDGVIFQTYSELFFYKNNKVAIIQAPSSFHFSFLVKNELYVNDLSNGLMRYAMGNLHTLVGLEELKGKEIWGIQSYDNKLLIALASEGVYSYDGNTLDKWETESLQFLMENQIFSAEQLNRNLFAFGTIQNGLLICNSEGDQIQHINMEDGLQNNTILCIEKDELGNLWLGTDLGIDYLELNSPLSQLNYSFGLGAGYACITYKGNLYLGTNKGLFVTNFENFKTGGIASYSLNLIEETRGQVWTLQIIDEKLFCGHNNGTFIIDGFEAELITGVSGGWFYNQVPDDPLKIIGGNYTGLALYQKLGDQWKFVKQYDNYNESSRIILFDKNSSLWMAHGYKGIFKINFDKEYDSILQVKLFNTQNSNLTSSSASAVDVDNEIIFSDLQRTYSFSSRDNDLIRNDKFNKYLEGFNIRALKQDPQGNLWYFTDKKSGVLRLQEDGNYSDISLPFQDINGKFVKGFEFVYSLDDENVFFGAENGFIHYNPSITKNYSYQFKTYLRSMRTLNEDSIYKVLSGGPKQIVLDYSTNDLEFIFSANDFENPDQTVFSTFLDGYDTDWTKWQSRSSRDFTNLNEGNYIFKIKAKNIYGTISEVVEIDFKVLPPFQRSAVAYFLYGLLFLILLIFIAWILKKRFERLKKRNEKEQLDNFRKKEERMERETLEAEKQIIRIRNENLRKEMKQKDKELANATMQTIQKNKMLITLRDELKKLAALTNNEGHKQEVNYLVRKINREINDENQWNVFETHFESVHEEFLKRLKTEFPELTPRELMLCAYLRLNISSKEISVLMNISTRGVEISRYRLRKKLQLKRDTNLTDFIITF